MYADPNGWIGAKMNEFKTSAILRRAKEIILKHEKGCATEDELEKATQNVTDIGGRNLRLEVG